MASYTERLRTDAIRYPTGRERSVLELTRDEGSGERTTPRFERKFAVEGMDRRTIETVVRQNPVLFQPAYHPRWINNIYFDTPDLQYLSDNLAGLAARCKVRIRWYGGMLPVSRPTLEFKIKQGMAGWKQLFSMGRVALDEVLDPRRWRTHVDAIPLSDGLRFLMTGLRPTLYNRYQRSYFESACHSFRCTVDSDIQYTRPASLQCNRAFFQADPLNIVEVKYALDDDERAACVTGAFPFRLSRNSKYVRGVECLY